MASRDIDRGLAGRAVVYLAAVGLIGWAMASLPGADSPDVLLAVGLVGALVITQLFPILVNHRTGHRHSLAIGVMVVMGFTVELPWAIVGIAIGSALSGLHIRKHRTTPGGMAFGTSWMTIAGAAAIAAQQQVDLSADPDLGPVVLRVAVHYLAHLVASLLCLGLIALTALTSWRAIRTVTGMVAPSSATVIALGLGAAGGYVYLTEPAALVLLVPLLVAILVGGSRGTLAAQERLRLAKVLDATGRARHQATIADLDDLVLKAARDVLGAPTRFDVGPGDDELGAPYPTAREPDRWLVAGRRHGPPTWLGQYLPDEARALDTLATVATATAHNLELVNEIRHRSLHDQLTGLANRIRLEEHTAQRIADGARHDRPFGLLVIDLDRFKEINDRHGHAGGDAALQAVADRLRSLCRQGDLAVRWGGEEFVLVAELPSDDPGECLRTVAARVVDGLAFALEITEGELTQLSASVGAASWPRHGHDLDSLFRAADAAVGAAKRAGRRTYVLADAAIGHDAASADQQAAR